jgi:hypothetical protein
VEGLQVGDPVWTANEAGERVEGVILQAARVRVPAGHQVIHVRLSDGRELWVSGGHPTADGILFADLEAGDVLDGAQVIEVQAVPYGAAYTFDILASGATGSYWANGIRVGSTLTNDR